MNFDRGKRSANGTVSRKGGEGGRGGIGKADGFHKGWARDDIDKRRRLTEKGGRQWGCLTKGLGAVSTEG